MKGRAAIEGLPFFSKVSLRDVASRIQLMGYAVEVNLMEKKKPGSRSTPPDSRKVFDSHGCRVGIVMAIWSSRHIPGRAVEVRNATMPAHGAKLRVLSGRQSL